MRQLEDGLKRTSADSKGGWEEKQQNEQHEGSLRLNRTEGNGEPQTDSELSGAGSGPGSCQALRLREHLELNNRNITPKSIEDQ